MPDEKPRLYPQNLTGSIRIESKPPEVQNFIENFLSSQGWDPNRFEGLFKDEPEKAYVVDWHGPRGKYNGWELRFSGKSSSESATSTDGVINHKQVDREMWGSIIYKATTEKNYCHVVLHVSSVYFENGVEISYQTVDPTWYYMEILKRLDSKVPNPGN